MLNWKWPTCQNWGAANPTVGTQTQKVSTPPPGPQLSTFSPPNVTFGVTRLYLQNPTPTSSPHRPPAKPSFLTSARGEVDLTYQSCLRPFLTFHQIQNDPALAQVGGVRLAISEGGSLGIGRRGGGYFYLSVVACEMYL